LKQQQEADARLEAARTAFDRLQQFSVEAKLPAEQIRQVRELQADRINQFERRRDLCGEGSELAARVDRLELALIQTEREYVNGLLRSGRITDEIRRNIERELDLREEVISRRLESGGEVPPARAPTAPTRTRP
jgi:CPA1 family monovalent cation:H+ antiporter